MLAPLLRFAAGAFAERWRSCAALGWKRGRRSICLTGAIAGDGARYDATV